MNIVMGRRFTKEIAFALSVLLFFCVNTQPTLADNNQQQLQSIQASIAEKERQIVEQKKTRERLLTELKKQETEMANLLDSIDKNEKQLKQLDMDIKSLISQVEALEKTQAEQQKILAKQLESAFRLGKNTGIELVLSGKESERNERIITYYGYINRARQAQINALKTTKIELDDKKQSLEDKRTQQQNANTALKNEQEKLQKNRNERQKTIRELDQSMQLNQQKLASLRENEARLQAQIQQAEKQSQRIAEEERKQAAQIQAKQKNYNYTPTASERSLMARVSGIGRPNHQLDWPVLGSVAFRFGEPLQGELRWKGLVINAKEGTQVKAVAEGRVILASWLQGYGFLVILDHGKGDMTLYGYNQRMLVNVGDKVNKGQAIALVGSSGGQGQSSLYFEVRREGKALDPSVWLKKR